MKRKINKVFQYFNRNFIHFKNSIISFVIIFYLKLIGVKIGRNNYFSGWASFLLADKSSIIIKGNCKFNSNCTSNRIGIKHKCIINTLHSNAIIEINKNCGFSGVSIGCFKHIYIGENVRVGANVLITDGDWHLDDPRVSLPKPIIIKDNVWLGYGAVVMKGVTIGENSVIGLNSVVTKDIPANVIAAGNPCKVIRGL